MINLLLTLCGILKAAVCVSCAVFAAYIINFDFGGDSLAAESAETDGN